MSNIKVIGEYQIKVTMFIVPRVRKTHFTNLEDSDEESSETYKRMEKLIKTREIELTMNITIATIQSNTYLGIEFQNGKVIYRKVEKVSGKTIIYRDCGNVAFIPDESKLTLYKMERCCMCKGMFKKIYRCFDCHPQIDGKEGKKKKKYDFCKACYKHREHTDHRAIAIILDESMFEKYPQLEDFVDDV